MALSASKHSNKMSVSLKSSVPQPTMPGISEKVTKHRAPQTGNQKGSIELFCSVLLDDFSRVRVEKAMEKQRRVPITFNE